MKIILPVVLGLYASFFHGFAVLADPIKIRINPSGILAKTEPDYTLWTVTNGETSASTTVSGVTFTLSAASGTTLKGSWYKTVMARFTNYLGERVVGEGMSTEATTGSALTLTIQGLSTGNHTLLSFHNAWDKIPAVTSLDVTVDGTVVVSVCTSNSIQKLPLMNRNSGPTSDDPSRQLLVIEQFNLVRFSYAHA